MLIFDTGDDRFLLLKTGKYTITWHKPWLIHIAHRFHRTRPCTRPVCGSYPLCKSAVLPICPHDVKGMTNCRGRRDAQEQPMLNAFFKRWAQDMALRISSGVLFSSCRLFPRWAGVTRVLCLLFGANTPWNRVRLTRGFGTSETSFQYAKSDMSQYNPADCRPRERRSDPV